MTPTDHIRLTRWTAFRTAASILGVVVVVLTLGLTCPTPTLADELVSSCGAYPNLVFHAYTNWGMTMGDRCPGGEFQINAGTNLYSRGQGAIWQANAPANMVIVDATAYGIQSFGINAGSTGQYGGDFYWQGGSSNINPHVSQASFAPLWSSDFGFLMVCGKNTCSNGNGNIYVGPIVLSVRETSGPWLSAPGGLWQAKGWVRGTWNLEFWGDSPSGLCALVADFGGQPLPGSSSPRNPSTWHQCAAGPVSDPVGTQAYPQGKDRLHIGAWDAAGETIDYTKTIYVDNQQPTISLSGPIDAPSTVRYPVRDRHGNRWALGGRWDLLLGRRRKATLACGPQCARCGQRRRRALRAVLGGQQRRRPGGRSRLVGPRNLVDEDRPAHSKRHHVWSHRGRAAL